MELLKILTFRVGSRNFGLASKSVKEILDSCGNLKAIFYGGGPLKGLMNFEGDIISVLDLPVVLGINEGQAQMVLICRGKGMERAVGLTITEVKGMKIVGSSGIDMPQVTDPHYISGFAREDETTVTILDLKNLLDSADSMIERLN